LPAGLGKKEPGSLGAEEEWQENSSSLDELRKEMADTYQHVWRFSVWSEILEMNK
jgi:hypothetical protein